MNGKGNGIDGEKAQDRAYTLQEMRQEGLSRPEKSLRRVWLRGLKQDKALQMESEKCPRGKT